MKLDCLHVIEMFLVIVLVLVMKGDGQDII